MTVRPEIIFSADAVTAGYGGAPIINDVSLQVGDKEIVCVVGPNGSGKSTLLKSLVGVIKVTSGVVVFGGEPITNWATEEIARHGIGYVPQVEDVFGPLTVRENLEMGGYLLAPREVNGRMDEVIQLFPQLGNMMSRRADRLSGGERKMLAMSRVLMLQPKLFVLDEPTANLAPLIAEKLLNEHVTSLVSTGAAVLLVEQRARTAVAISDWTYVMGGGHCTMDAASPEMEARPDFVDSFLGGVPASER